MAAQHHGKPISSQFRECLLRVAQTKVGQLLEQFCQHRLHLSLQMIAILLRSHRLEQSLAHFRNLNVDNGITDGVKAEFAAGSENAQDKHSKHTARHKLPWNFANFVGSRAIRIQHQMHQLRQGVDALRSLYCVIALLARGSGLTETRHALLGIADKCFNTRRQFRRVSIDSKQIRGPNVVASEQPVIHVESCLHASVLARECPQHIHFVRMHQTIFKS